ncbi:MAG: trypsin-like peptidase domain-containing protein [Synergistaceae bacterium]|nr:trypsin-like peptidase domain-containing protein [Synergistaceae bacterium]
MKADEYMTPDEACWYLGISPDDTDLDIDRIERNYHARMSIYDPIRFAPDTPEYDEARRMRQNIEAAYEYLVEAYYDIYGHDDAEEETQPQKSPQPVSKEKPRGNIIMKLALIMSTVTALTLGYFLYTSRESPKNDRDYSRLLHEIEQLRAKTDIPIQQNNIAPDYADLVERVMPSIVMIKTDTGTGSGFFVSANGDILTNWHVIQGAGYITVTPQNGASLSASLKDYDAEKDMALLMVKTSSPVKFLTISPRLPRQGEAVIAIGNPKGLSGTVSNGIVSAFRENNTWVQFTAPISPGSSGGALVNLRGEVVGMPTKLRTDGQNLNFAIAPGILSRFFQSARDKTPRKLPGKSDGVDTGSMIFVRSDESYEMYIAADYIEYDSANSQAAFVSVWFPTERTNRQMKRDPNFRAVHGKNFGPCILLYAVDLSDNTYLHLRTVNLYTDGSIARDYVRPQRDYRWEKPARGSRINELIGAVRKYLGR